MRLHLTVQRQGLPPVQVLWTTTGLRPTPAAGGASTTISQLLEQVNEVIPLEAEEWGLEDYSVEVGGFECLHFAELCQILKEEDHVKSVLLGEVLEIEADIDTVYVLYKLQTYGTGRSLGDTRFLLMESTCSTG